MKSLQYGVIVVDKPRGPSSHEVAAYVGRMLGDVKVGHSGTLDPGVSGILSVMIGRAVKLAPLLLNEDKEYVCLLRLHGDVPEARIREVASTFVGRIYQRPPKKSAVKRALRIRRIYELEILEIKGRDVLFRVACEAGTYIRSLCHHMGLLAGTGGHMQELRRTGSGSFTESNAYTLHEISDACALAREGDPSVLEQMILPPERAALALPKVVIRDTAVDAVCRGAVLAGVGVLEKEQFKKGEHVVLMTTNDEMVCIGTPLVSSKDFSAGDTGLVVQPRKVLMEPGTYAKGWKSSEND